MTFKRSGVKFICAENDKRLAPFDALNFSSYEAEELDMQLALMNPKGNILDIGGNYGWYALHIANGQPGTKIYSFEPIPKTFEHLNQNIKLNKIENILTYNFGLSNENGKFTFFYDPALSVNASLQNLASNDDIETVNCSVRKLDNFWEVINEDIDFIKCDIEGAELLAFQGGIISIQKFLPVIFTEMLRKWTSKFNYHPNEIIELLGSIGYNCYTLDGDKLKSFNKVDENTKETNYFFLHPEKHKELIGIYTI
jgi:FkbM family methyltransferase